MKTLRSFALFFSLAFATLLTTAGAKTIDNPVIRGGNNKTIDVVGVTTGNDATILDIHAKYYPKYWIRISSDSYLETNGKKYKLTKTEGITPDTEFWMPESGEADFRLFFEPVPDTATCVDFIEGNEEGAFRLWDIDLTGEADPYAANPGIPVELLDIRPSFAMSDQIFKVADTRLNVHMPGKKLGMESIYSVYVNSLTGQKEAATLKLDKNGNGVLDLTLYGTSYIMFLNERDNHCYSVLVAPGENIDIYLDNYMSGRAIMAERKDNSAFANSLHPFPTVYHSGIYAPFEKAVLKANNEIPQMTDIMNSFRLESHPEISYEMPTSEYLDKMLEIYKSNLNIIDTLDQNDDIKTYLYNTLTAILLSNIGSSNRMMSWLYWEKTGSRYGSPVPEGKIKVKIGPNEWRKVIEAVKNTEDTRLLPIAIKYTMIEELLGLNSGLCEVLPDDAMLSKLSNYYTHMKKLDSGDLTDKDIMKIRQTGDSFYADALETRRLEIAAINEKFKDAAVQPTPEVANDKVFDAIVAPHKGKVVIVDLWNTWCAPCRKAIATIEPMKDNELKKDDLVWIYIANQTSPEEKYLELVSGIKGLHYRLNAEQWEAIHNRFQVDGIPFYILVDRDGTAERRPDLRDHDRYKKVLLEK